ncbi:MULTISPECIES: hypothetical protein [Shouchella]|uniref:hypothetical protein n=1 Tax=Shouchella TaxID=2893057 RepID=UPI0009141600|nr:MULTISPECIES: hypothetical protein [Shouchella]MBX0317427.1 hypothetical protein [Shouchella clausii]SHL86683.1 hypothetical protein SAMN05192535_3721 [Shouchella rhizosphaerae]
MLVFKTNVATIMKNCVLRMRVRRKIADIQGIFNTNTGEILKKLTTDRILVNLRWRWDYEEEWNEIEEDESMIFYGAKKMAQNELL